MPRPPAGISLTNSLSLPVCATENPIDPIDRPTASSRLTASR